MLNQSIRTTIASVIGCAIVGFAQPDANAWASHAALCGEAKENCTVSFTDDGIRAGSVIIPAGMMAGYGGIDKSERTCNIYGMCYRSVFQSEVQEFTISYLDEKNTKQTLLVSFVNVKAAQKFGQELQAFGQLANAMKGKKAPRGLSAAEASHDVITRTPAHRHDSISFSEWTEISPINLDGKEYKRYYTPRLAKKVNSDIFEYSTMIVGNSVTIQSAARIDCRRSLATYSEQSVSGADRNPVQAWVKPEAIVPGQIAFEVASKLCLTSNPRAKSN